MIQLDLAARKHKPGYRVSYGDRVVGVIKPHGNDATGWVWKAKPTGSSVWTLWPDQAAAAMHCLQFVGWADLAS